MKESDLSGLRVLLVEDDYHLATDAEAALRSVGAAVFGPCGDEESGLALGTQGDIDCAVLDVNLGSGPSFTLAHAMRAHGIPFLFVTGYDRDAIPNEFSDVERLQKPYMERDLLSAVARLV